MEQLLFPGGTCSSQTIAVNLIKQGGRVLRVLAVNNNPGERASPLLEGGIWLSLPLMVLVF